MTNTIAQPIICSWCGRPTGELSPDPDAEQFYDVRCRNCQTNATPTREWTYDERTATYTHSTNDGRTTLDANVNAIRYPANTCQTCGNQSFSVRVETRGLLQGYIYGRSRDGVVRFLYDDAVEDIEICTYDAPSQAGFVGPIECDNCNEPYEGDFELGR